MSRWPKSTLSAEQRDRLAKLRANRIAGRPLMTRKERQREVWLADRQARIERAAKLAHDEPMTCRRAALIHRVPAQKVLDVYGDLYPDQRRSFT